jgi:5-methylcytosine-specific restriction enzyme subunit McrC
MPELIELFEYTPKRIPREALTTEIARMIWQNHGNQIAVDPPSFQTNDQWQLTSLGYVGYLPITPDLTLALRPKVPLRNLFGMLEYAYRIDFKFFEGLVDCATLEAFYERLASVLAKRVIDRQRKGLHRKYVSRTERSEFIRGRLNLMDRIRRPWDVFSECRFEEHTPQIEDNEILGWTLRGIAQGGVCSERVRPTIRHAYRGMNGIDCLTAFSGKSCTGRLYNRLNADYETLHALCRFFLERGGPEHKTGDHSMLPFLVDMNKLFEQFVAEWLRAHLSKAYSLQIQSHVVIGEDNNLRFIIDLMVTDVRSGETVCVLDTKYKRGSAPTSSDVEQAIAYAEAKGCQEAVLVYPIAIDKPIDSTIGRIRIRSLAFSLDGDVEAAGKQFLSNLLFDI